jgi:hypothetical protein
MPRLEQLPLEGGLVVCNVIVRGWALTERAHALYLMQILLQFHMLGIVTVLLRSTGGGLALGLG